MSEVFQARHADPACREKICLQDYEAAFARHQEVQFRKYQEHKGYATAEQAAIAESFERFRDALWGEGSYASRILLRVHPPGRTGSQTFRLEDIAVDGEVRFEDMKAFLELGRVEVLVPGYFCGASGSGMSAGLEIYLDKGRDFSRADFKALIRELDELRPLHGEGMGNAFWFRCVEAVFPSPPKSEEVFPRTSVVLSLAQDLLLNLATSAASAVSPSCAEEDIAYFDEDQGVPVCDTYEEEAVETGGALGLLGQGLSWGVAGGAAGGAMAFSKFGAGRIGAAGLKISIQSPEE